jgi:hypothetical protein
VSVQAFSPFNPTAAWSAATYGGSGYFDGSGDYLTFTPSSATVCPADFTLEMWLLLDLASDNYVAGQYGNRSVNGDWLIYITTNGGGTIYLAGDQASPRLSISSGAIKSGQWNHFALVRSGSTVTCYVNGVSVGTATKTTDFGVTDISYQIGSYYTSTLFCKGYIAGYRLVKGTAVYTSAFTPPTSPPTAISGTSLLLNFTNAGIYDATSKNDLETVGNAQISTAQSKFGGSSMYFDGSSDRLTILFTNDFLELGINGQNFTVEAWVYPTNSMPSAGQILSKGGGTASWSTSSGAQYQWTIVSSAASWNFNSAGSSITVNSGTVTLNAWQHLAVTYDGTTTRTFLNGVLQSTSTSSYTAPTTRNLQYIGMTQSGGFTQEYYGYINDLRITKGYARYTANFTPPTAAFPLL